MNSNHLIAGIKRIYQAQLEYQMSQPYPDMKEINLLRALLARYA